MIINLRLLSDINQFQSRMLLVHLFCDVKLFDTTITCQIRRSFSLLFFNKAMEILMKFKIFKNVDSHLIKERVPTKYKNLAAGCESQLSDTCTLITFPHNNRDIVKSGLAEKALKCLGKMCDPQLVVVGGCFSIEATNILNAKNTLFLSLSDKYRTDSYQKTV